VTKMQRGRKPWSLKNMKVERRKKLAAGV
jgi:hypothetical protein